MIVKHRIRRPEIEKVVLKKTSTTIWLTPDLEVRLQKGDLLRDLAALVQKKIGVNRKESLQISAYYFALGERVTTGRLGKSWKKGELRTDIERRFLEQ
jgi:hypothetical protein